MEEWYYPKIKSEGLARSFAQCPVPSSIEEKLDGSQLSFCARADGEGLEFFNRGRVIVGDPASDGVFRAPMALLGAHFETRRLDPSYIYHCETIGKLRHNKTVYERVPALYVVLFDVQHRETKHWLESRHVAELGAALGLETVRILWQGMEDPASAAKELLAQMEVGTLPSMLGGKPEGLVVKNVQFVKGTKVSATKIKLVRKQFKEAHSLKSAPLNAAPVDANAICARIMACFPREPRWDKAIQRARDQERQPTERDVRRDFDEECRKTLLKYLEHELVPFMISSFSDGFKEYLEQLSKQ